MGKVDFDATRGFGKFRLWSWLLQLNATQTCLQAIDARAAVEGAYDYAGRGRLDALWFDDFPAAVWASVQAGAMVTPEGNDYDHINDRFVLAPM